MYPHTRGLLSALMAEDPEGSSVDFAPDDAAMHDPQTLQLRIRKKHQMGLLKKMLEDAGYGDLAKMTTLSKRDFDDEIEG